MKNRLIWIMAAVLSLTACSEQDNPNSDPDEPGKKDYADMMGLVQPGMPNTIFDALPMLRWKSIEKTPNNVHVTLDYGKYGIDLRADDNGVYFPFATINDLYADGFMHVAAFNGQTVMVAPNGAYSLVDGYPAFFTTPILQEKRPADLVDAVN